MSTLATKLHDAVGVRVEFDDAMMHVDLLDGRRISVPLEWFPKLSRATPEQRRNWRWIGGGIGIHWEDLDEDVSIEGLLKG
ncbi:DUF2442 domain-containing protein [Carboxydochorda subterranea]|uniref:DUF2442 domain-containing protein n=1 Tax=Carboxydichorda subterranea TaxID=3109565 RepID=A0ABZ1BXN2_9FIRM|nr:DUF2442 domain-containing protein [Limnochorda sp. L945t]WRP17385.1 DUF2442 domain-containing protein [Limnochorda sp. L945t]